MPGCALVQEIWTPCWFPGRENGWLAKPVEARETRERVKRECNFKTPHAFIEKKEVRRCVCKARGSVHTRGCCSSNATCPETSRISWSGRAVLSTIWSFVWLVLKHTNIYKHANIFFLTEFVALRPPSSPPPVYYIIISDAWWSDGGWLGMSVYIVSIANSLYPFGKLLLSYFLPFQSIFSWYNRTGQYICWFCPPTQEYIVFH